MTPGLYTAIGFVVAALRRVVAEEEKLRAFMRGMARGFENVGANIRTALADQAGGEDNRG